MILQRFRPLATCPAPGGAALAAILTACALGQGNFPADTAARTAEDVPARFEPMAPAMRVAPSDTISGGGCNSPLRDPRDGTALRLERAITPRGDYAVPAGRYGVGPGELLRVDCNTGRAIGIVRR
ncbi:MAG TPA: hypothetical protein VJ847_05860 [Gemmatimonadales bacterium]|jgi:hypothetical protein|nr:hypothetical protein [Gemmatimonadales bacterium]